KLEEELEVKIFDRNSHPVEPTIIGMDVIRQAREILHKVVQLKDSLMDLKKEISGKMEIAVIPTVAPYILPGFFTLFKQAYPQVSLSVTEMKTSLIKERLKTAQIDMAILATPLKEKGLLEIPLYYEKFLAYVSAEEKDIYAKKRLKPKELTLEHLWVLEDGHCLRGQIFNFCGRDASSKNAPSFSTHIYNASSMETLIKVVDANGGYTVIPELHAPLLTNKQRKNIRPFILPEPVREISLVVREDFIREGLLNAVASTVKRLIPEAMLDTHLKKFAIRL
ncbi:MAG: LysR substrate-binding domain-containing protein, partial [Bacteroidales bacterium]